MSLYLVTGPPAAGKSTWVKQHAKHGDITIDFDALASVLTATGGDPHDPPQAVRAVTKAARQAAIDAAIALAADTDVYVIHSMPGAKLLNHYLAHDAEVVTIDPGEEIVMQRVTRERPRHMIQATREWYANRAERHADDQPVTSLGRPSESW